MHRSQPRRPALLTGPGPARGATLAMSGAALLWIPQAALLAHAVGRLAQGAGLVDMLLPALAFLVLGVLRASSEAWGARRLFAVSRSQLTAMRQAAVQALAARSPLDRARLPSGQAASIVAEQAEAVLPWLLRYGPARMRVLLAPPVIALVVCYFSWLAALILVLAAPLIPLFMAVIGWRAKAASEAQLQLVGGMSGFLLDRLRGLSTLRALGAVDATARRVRASGEAVRASTMRVLRIAFLSSTALELFSALGVALVAVYVGFHLLGEIGPGSWGSRLTLAEGLFVLLLAPAFFEPLRELAAVWHDKAAGEAALEALDKLQAAGLPLPGALQEPDEALCIGRAPSVDIEGLRFAHPGEAPLFDNQDVYVRVGEHVALVGPSGSGKTTLLSMIAGLVPVDSGTVRIGGVPLDAGSAAGLRARMAWIGQKPHVFAGSVRANVALERDGVTVDAVSHAVARAGLGRIEHATPGESLGEGGLGLSGGELVRLALARAMCAPHAGLLLVDEPTAHLDRDTAAGVIEALLQLAQGRTMIVATHDLALAARLGRVVRLGEPLIQRSAA
ncbi:ATP-binding cassette subfamily C protein CydD [Massilia aurea]|uniref:ATP-binding cassette subfamily C protein CydD n=1 Tax=Massilia aurea TaxID=373040 RepID=A0A7W9X002_9BURK|nr:thiol reductant ABC exporter subunit CydD [Massilia aurea]MBB6133907.1 ATP-binding cassette subfamily C protein CydD [Massilia aurea]